MLVQMEGDPRNLLVHSHNYVFLYKQIVGLKIFREGLILMISSHNCRSSPDFQIQAFLSHSQSPSNLLTLKLTLRLEFRIKI